MRNCFWVAWATVHELVFERFFHLLIFFSIASLGMSALLGSLTYTEQAKLTLDFMLGTTQLSLVLFALFIGISLFHREFSIGSVYLVLSKPVSRASFLAGKFLGQAFVQAVVVFAMTALALLIRSRFDVPLYFGPIAQAGLLIFLESLVVAAMTYFFAVNAGAVLTAVSTLALFGLAHFREPVTRELAGSKVTTWSLLRPLIPDLEVLNLKNLASYGVGLSGTEFFYVIVYALCTTAFFLILGLISFQHKDIGNS